MQDEFGNYFPDPSEGTSLTSNPLKTYPADDPMFAPAGGNYPRLPAPNPLGPNSALTAEPAAEAAPGLASRMFNAAGPIAALYGGWQGGQWLGNKIANYFNPSGDPNKAPGHIAALNFMRTPLFGGPGRHPSGPTAQVPGSVSGAPLPGAAADLSRFQVAGVNAPMPGGGSGFAPGGGAATAPPVGALAANQQSASPFTMIMRPNAPAESGGRGGGGPGLTTALDLSGWQQPAMAPAASPAATPAYRAPAPAVVAPRARAQVPRPWAGFPQFTKGGQTGPGTKPSWWNPVMGTGPAAGYGGN